MWKTPYRPANQISQTFNDGLISIYSVADEAEPGRQPKKRLTLKARLCFDERRLGVQRYYSAKQAMSDVERVVRVPLSACRILTQDVAMLTGEPVQYSITLVQAAQDVYPPSLDLTLSRISQALPVAAEGGGGDG